MVNISEPTEAIKQEARALRIKLIGEIGGLWMYDPEPVILNMLCNGIQDRAEIEAEILKFCEKDR